MGEGPRFVVMLFADSIDIYIGAAGDAVPLCAMDARAKWSPDGFCSGEKGVNDVHGRIYSWGRDQYFHAR